MPWFFLLRQLQGLLIVLLILRKEQHPHAFIVLPLIWPLPTGFGQSFLKLMGQEEAIDGSRTGVIGHSEGGLIAAKGRVDVVAVVHAHPPGDCVLAEGREFSALFINRRKYLSGTYRARRPTTGGVSA